MPMPPPKDRPSRRVLALLVLASLTLITLDSRAGSSSPLDPLRAAVGSVLGPAESGTTAAVRPFRTVGGLFHTTTSLRSDVARLEAENATLKGQLETSALDRNRAAELDGLMNASRRTGYALVPARVVAYGPAQSFSRTVTIDAGTSSGIHPDMTVLNNDGLVGRVVAATIDSATVLLIVDRESVVGGRLGSDLKIGFVRGRGGIGDAARLDLDLLDSAATPARNDTVVTWGSRNGAPYLPGIPIGKVVSVYASPRQLSQRAVLTPFVDFGALDVVGVVVRPGIHTDRGPIDAGGAAGGTR